MIWKTIWIEWNKSPYLIVQVEVVMAAITSSVTNLQALCEVFHLTVLPLIWRPCCCYCILQIQRQSCWLKSQWQSFSLELPWTPCSLYVMSILHSPPAPFPCVTADWSHVTAFEIIVTLWRVHIPWGPFAHSVYFSFRSLIFVFYGLGIMKRQLYYVYKPLPQKFLLYFRTS